MQLQRVDFEELLKASLKCNDFWGLGQKPHACSPGQVGTRLQTDFLADPGSESHQVIGYHLGLPI